MKKEFSSHWVASVQPRKQRKYRYNAPLHVRGKFLSAHLSKDLASKHKTRSLRIRVGDEVKAMRGQFAGRSGKVERVDVTRSRVFVSSLDYLKRDGSKKPYPLQPSNLLLIKLTDDKRRLPVEAKKRTPGTPNVPKGAASPKKAPTTDKKAAPASTKTKIASPASRK